MNDDGKVGESSDRIGARSDCRRVPPVDHDDYLAMRAGWRALSERQRREFQAFLLKVAKRVTKPKVREVRLADPTVEPTDEDLHAIAAAMHESVLATHPPDSDPTLQAVANAVTAALLPDRTTERAAKITATVRAGIQAAGVVFRHDWFVRDSDTEGAE